MPAAWRDALGAWRNRILGQESTRERLIRFWPTRWVARKEAARLFDLVGGFVYSQVLFCVVRLGWVERLASSPRSRDELAQGADMPPEALDRLLAAASALELIEQRSDGRWQLGAVGAALQDNAAVQAMVLHHDVLYADLADPLALLRSSDSPTRLSRYWDYRAATRKHDGENADAESAGQGSQEASRDVMPYTRLMSASQPLVARLVLQAYPFARHRCLLDVGGGDGTFLKRVADEIPGLQMKLWDVPPVVDLARANIRQAGLEARIECVPGNFHQDPVPQGVDLITLLRVLHDHNDGPALTLLKRLYQALPNNGALVLAEPMADAPGATRMGDAYFGFYLWAMRSGRPRSLHENKELLRAAGFRQITAPVSPLPLQAQVLVAGKSA